MDEYILGITVAVVVGLLVSVVRHRHDVFRQFTEEEERQYRMFMWCAEQKDEKKCEP